VEMGGGTGFPKLGFGVQPVKGIYLIKIRWRNISIYMEHVFLN